MYRKFLKASVFFILTVIVTNILFFNTANAAPVTPPPSVEELQKQIQELQRQLANAGALAESTYGPIIEELQRQLREAQAEPEKPKTPRIKLQQPTVMTVNGTSAVTNTLTLKNIGTGQASNVLVQLDLAADSPFVAYFPDSSNFIRSVSETGTASVKLRIEPERDAKAGTYPIALTYTYVDGDNKEMTSSDKVYLRLDTGTGGSVSANAVLYEFSIDRQSIQAGDSFALGAFIENTGDKDARDIQVVIDGLKADEIYLEGSTGSFFYREMKPGSRNNPAFNLKASDKAKTGTYTLTFKVTSRNENGEQTEKTYPYYVFVSGAGAADAARLKTGNITVPSYAVEAGSDFTVTIPVINEGPGTAYDIEVTAGEDPAIVPKSTPVALIPQLAAGASETVSFSFMPTKDSLSRNYAIKFIFSYKTSENAENEDIKTFPQYAGVTVSNPDADEADEEKKSVPKIIISNYKSDPMVVKAGENFDLSISFQNTHPERAIKNVKAYLTATDETEKKGNVFTPVDASNTFYIDEIQPKAVTEKHLTFYTVPDAAPRNYIVNVNFEYEDSDGTAYTSVEQFGINVKQTTKIDTGDINIPPEGFIGQPISVYFDFYNTGKVALSNLLIKMDGEFDMSTTSSYYSNLLPGNSDMYDMIFIPNETGERSGRIVISYEDDSGELIEEYREFTVNVMEMPMIDPEFGGDFPGMGMMPEEEKTMFGKIVDFIKKPVFIVSASVTVVVIAAAIILIARRVRRKRREMDLDE